MAHQDCKAMNDERKYAHGTALYETQHNIGERNGNRNGRTIICFLREILVVKEAVLISISGAGIVALPVTNLLPIRAPSSSPVMRADMTANCSSGLAGGRRTPGNLRLPYRFPKPWRQSMEYISTYLERVRRMCSTGFRCPPAGR